MDRRNYSMVQRSVTLGYSLPQTDLRQCWIIGVRASPVVPAELQPLFGKAVDVRIVGRRFDQSQMNERPHGTVRYRVISSFAVGIDDAPAWLAILLEDLDAIHPLLATTDPAAEPECHVAKGLPRPGRDLDPCQFVGLRCWSCGLLASFEEGGYERALDCTYRILACTVTPRRTISADDLSRGLFVERAPLWIDLCSFHSASPAISSRPSSDSRAAVRPIALRRLRRPRTTSHRRPSHGFLRHMSTSIHGPSRSSKLARRPLAPGRAG